MKLLRPESKRVPSRVKGSEVLTRPPVEEGFKADRVVTAEGRKKLLSGLLRHKEKAFSFRNNFLPEAVNFKFSFPADVEALGLDESVWKMVEKTLKSKPYNPGPITTAELASSAKLLFPEKAQLLNSTKVFMEVKKEIADSLRFHQEGGNRWDHFLSIAFGAKVLFPDRLQELGIQEEVVSKLIQRRDPVKYIGMRSLFVFRMKMIFPTIFEELNLDQYFERNEKELREEMKVTPPGFSFVNDGFYLGRLMGLQLLADDARIDSNGLIVIPSKVQLREAPQLPNRPAF